MAATNVDLSAVLPALKEAVEPFVVAMKQAQQTKVNPASKMRNFFPLANMALGDVQRLVDSVQAVRRMAGDIP